MQKIAGLMVKKKPTPPYNYVGEFLISAEYKLNSEIIFYQNMKLYFGKYKREDDDRANHKGHTLFFEIYLKKK